MLKEKQEEWAWYSEIGLLHRWTVPGQPDSPRGSMSTFLLPSSFSLQRFLPDSTFNLTVQKYPDSFSCYSPISMPSERIPVGLFGAGAFERSRVGGEVEVRVRELCNDQNFVVQAHQEIYSLRRWCN